MSKAIIYCPDKNPMQSGKAKAHSWILEFIPQTPYFTDGFMGWNGMSDTKRELNLRFPSMEAAVEYAKKQNIDCEIFVPNARNQQHKAYSDNFAFNKIK
ncbi:MAG: NADH dehydrogenase ubiquinone Fe-S protein 4 [Rickettsiales bacterium]